MQFLFENHVLDAERRELRRGSELIALEPQVFDLLIYLVQNRDRVVSKDDMIAAVWGGRIVSESTLTSRINAVRKAVGDSGDEQRLIRTSARKGIRFVCAVTEAAQSSESATTAAAAPPIVLQHEIHFCTTVDGDRLAYAEVVQGPPLVKSANWLNHLEYDWQSPVWSPFLHELAKDRRLIRYDERGNGLSDWDVEDISFEAFVRDLETIVDAVNLDRFDMFGISGGCGIAIAYAVRHPERLRRLVLYGGFARGSRKRDSQRQIELVNAATTLMRHGWGQEYPAFRQMFTSQFIPGGTAEQAQWFNDLQRMTTSPENAARTMEAIADTDVSNLLPLVQVPTLVLHCRDDARVPFEEGRKMAAGIPGAQFVALEGRNHVILEGDPGWGRFLDETKTFLRS